MLFQNISAKDVVTARMEPQLIVPLAAIILTTCTIGILGNILILVAVLISQRLRTVGNMFIINLTLIDLVMCCIVKPMALTGIFAGGDFYNNHQTLCIVTAMITVTLCVSSIINIVAIAINRYVQVCLRGSYNSIYTRRRAAGMCVAIWVIGFLPNFYYIFAGVPYHFDPKLLLCLYDRDSSYHFNIGLYTLCLCQNAIVGLAYWKLFRLVAKSSQRLSRTSSESSSLLKAVFTIFLVYTVCWGPFLFIGLIDGHDRAPRFAYVITVCMALINSSSDWIIYTLNNRYFKEAYRQIFGCKAPEPNNCKSSNSPNTEMFSNIKSSIRNH
ncbi:melatonin receptor type 1B-B-like [Liolophura sinensis]|uniref:melatonin receptor type 1B-B-like n=1 Tax=Liolophura sinensis TaxID=3198878 RepID=UPI003158D2D4